ncbi:MAG: hemolysin family protein [Planctomycetota bacterium]|nr:hemolysin family protein [Planctomycetota bacterium]
MPDWFPDLVKILVALLLVLVNGFFVAAEFSLVKVRLGRIEQLVANRKLFSRTARWLAQRLEQSLSACQLGITMASLALGTIGEPAFAKLVEPLLHALQIQSEAIIHAVAFAISFTFVTALHLVIGEQAPKIFAIRKPETILLACAVPLQIFFIATYPLMQSLNVSTTWLLKMFGSSESSKSSIPYTEEEIRALLREAHVHGNLTGSEHSLINAVFEFADLVCRRIMVSRTDVDFVDINEKTDVTLAMIHRTKHTRYPICDGSLDDVLGVLHVKDISGETINDGFDWKSLMRPPKKVPENMPISKLLRHFQGTHQHMAFVVDEYGMMIGIVTLENVLEEIIGEVADEFDIEDPEIVPDGSDSFIILGSTAVQDVENRLGIRFEYADVDTMSGLLLDKAERLLVAGDVIEFPNAIAKVLSVSDDRATKVRLTLIS